MDIYSVFMLCGGLAFFLFGMNVMSGSLEKLAGGRLQDILKKLTSNPLKSLGLGAVITIAIQSSSALTVMLVGLVNSGIMEVSQTIHVIMGSDIGTTMTAWILSLNGIESDNFLISMLKPQNFSPVIALIGVILIMGGKTQRKRDVGTIFCGFAVLMYGMTLMSDAVEPLADMPQFQKLLVAFDNPLLGVLIGTAFTGVIQSSAASIGILQALSLTGSISFGMAIPIVMGANIGTCVTALLSSIGVSRKAKQIPAIHVLIKILGTIIWMALYLILRYAVGWPIFGQQINSFQIAVFHTIFNIGTILILLPFTGKILSLSQRMVFGKEKGSESADKEPEKKVLIDERLLLSPGLAVRQCREKTIEMARLAQEAFLSSMDVVKNFKEETVEEICKKEDETDYMEDELDTFLIRLSAKDLTEVDSDLVSEMLHAINDFERIGDHAINMTKIARQMQEQRLAFSPAAIGELEVLDRALKDILQKTVDCFAQNDEHMAAHVEPLEQVIDDLTREIKNRHIERLKTGECSGELGIVLTDLLTNYERVSDHCSNVGVAVIETKNSSFETHDYLNDLKKGNSTSFVMEFEHYQREYALAPFKYKKKKKKGAAADSDKKKNRKK